TMLLYNASYQINRVASIEEALTVIREQVRYFAPTQIDVFLVVTRRDTNATEWVLHWNSAEDESTESINLVDAPAIDDIEMIESEPYFIDDISTAPSHEAALMNRLKQYDGFTAQASVPLNVAGRSTGRLVISFNRTYHFDRLERQFI